MTTLPVASSEPRWGLVRRGAVVVGVGLVLLVVGGVMFVGRDAVAVAKPAARSALPGEARFDARAGRYAVLLSKVTLVGGPPEITVAATECTVRRGDGSTVRLRGARQRGSSDSSFALSIGTFDARPGPTRVACDKRISGPAKFVVARRRSSVSVAMWALIGGGLLVACAGGVLVARGFTRPVVTVA